MNDPIEQLLGQLTPRGVRPDLRPQVLAAVATELQTEVFRTGVSSAPQEVWLRRCGWAVAASLLVGIALNIWANESSKRRLAELYGPPPVSKQAMELAKAIEEVTDAQTGQWVYQRLTAPRQACTNATAYDEYRATLNRLIAELQIVSEDSYHETPEKAPEMDRHRPRRTGGDRSGCQRGVRLDHRYTA